MNIAKTIDSADATLVSEPDGPSPSRALAILLCLVPASYFLVVAGYALFNFSAYGADLPRFLRYIGGPLAIAGLLVFASTKLSTKRSSELGLTASAILVTLLLVEIVLNARLLFAMFNMVALLGTGSAETDQLARGQAGIPPMYNTKQISRELEIEQLDQAVLGGVPDKEVLLCAHNGAPLYYTADRFGFNNPDSVHDAPLDLIVVGDSFVEGHCQPRADTFVGRMRTLRPQTASFGMRSGGPLLELAFIGRYGVEFKPDYVVMAFFEGNDWQNLGREADTPWLRQALDEDATFGNAEVTANERAEIGQVVEQWWDKDVSPSVVFSKSSFVRNIVALNEVWGVLGLDYPRVNPDQPIYPDVLAKAKALTESWGGKFALVYIPQDARFRGLFNKSFVYDRLRGKVLNAAAASNIEVIDLTEKFAEADEPTELYAPDAHFSPAGAQLAAEAVEEWIASVEAINPPASE